MRSEFPAKVRQAALERAGWRCEGAGERYGHEPGIRCNADLQAVPAEIDHFPLGAHAEGSNTLENAVACCRDCNQFAANHTDKAAEAKIKRRAAKFTGLVTRVKKPIAQPKNFKWPSRPFNQRVSK